MASCMRQSLRWSVRGEDGALEQDTPRQSRATRTDCGADSHDTTAPIAKSAESMAKTQDRERIAMRSSGPKRFAA